MQTPQTLWHRHYTEIRNILRLSIPVAAGLLLNRMIPFISVVFVGHLGPAELAAASLGSSLSNILGLAVMAGLAGAITTLSGQVSNPFHSPAYPSAPPLSNMKMSVSFASRVDMLMISAGCCSACFETHHLCRQNQTGIRLLPLCLWGKVVAYPASCNPFLLPDFRCRHMGRSSMRLWGMCGSVP